MTPVPPSTATIAREVTVTGRGIHSGLPCSVVLHARPAGSGITFQRPTPGAPVVAADLATANAEASDRRTVLVGAGGERFEQVEHLMAALYACGITDAHVVQNGPEVPFLGGGSREYMESIRGAGVTPTGGIRGVLEVTRPVQFQDGEAFFAATPHDGLRLSAFVEFPGTVVGHDGFSLEVDEESFFREVSAARTFALARDLEKLRAAGLIKGGDLGNAVVFDHERYYNESLHYPNEVVRHKIIDLLGDLALTQRTLRGHFWAWRAGHRSHVRFAQFLDREFPASR